VSRIISPTPIVLTIEVNQVTNAAAFRCSHTMALLDVLAIFQQIGLQLIADAARQGAAGPTVGGPARPADNPAQTTADNPAEKPRQSDGSTKTAN
jgi:hypothetical protein